MNNTAAHQQLCSDIRFELQKAYPDDLRIFQRNVGLAIPYQSYIKDPKPHPIMYGVKGEADLQGLLKWPLPNTLKCIAASFAFEVKTGAGRLDKDQIKWREMFVKIGGIYIVAHSVEESLNCIKEYLAHARMLCQCSGRT